MRTTPGSPSNRAFSLVELSIVLVILGLLVGGVLSGQSLIRASELRSITTDFSKYSTAVYAFRDKYFGLPGDLSNAITIWGDGGTDCTTAAGQTFVAGTCNGDGNGKINPVAPSGPSFTGEAFRAWQQLALAGLIEGKYTGKANSYVYNGYVVGTNAPKSRISNAGWNLSNSDLSGYVSSNAFQYDFTNVMEIGKPLQCFGCSNMDGGFLQPPEAWNIDTKIDDGQPGLGKVTVNMLITNCSNATNSTNYTATYLLSGTGTCGLYFRYLN